MSAPAARFTGACQTTTRTRTSEACHDAPKLLECVAVQRVQDARRLIVTMATASPIDDQVLEVVARLR